MPISFTTMTATRPGSPNSALEDRIHVGKDVVVVLDGVTTVAEDAAVLGGTYAERLGKEIAVMAAAPGCDLRAVLAEAIARTARALKLGPRTVPGRSPQTTVAVGRWQEGRFEAAVIGDSPVVVIRSDGAVSVLTDDRVAALAARLPERQEQHGRLVTGAGRIGDDRHRELTRAIMRQMGGLVNRSGGYWIAGADPRAGREAFVRSWPLEEVTDILIATDGASAVVDKYGLLTWQEVATHSRVHGPDAVLDLVCAADDSDPHGHRWPRSKPSDDKTLAHLRPSS
ncbi:protein phosphatase 2C domain-containing protein [Kitasatospora indigofera]|uniref:protein phosphatase 2C domain-containing protein n=1 Tax=Kitasatospora indigofera TaxID=67307 RepID=UPI0036581291